MPATDRPAGREERPPSSPKADPLVPLRQAESVVDALTRVSESDLDPHGQAAMLLRALQTLLGHDYDCELVLQALAEGGRPLEIPKVLERVTVGPTFEQIEPRPDEVVQKLIDSSVPAVRLIVPKTLEKRRTPRTFLIGTDVPDRAWFERTVEQFLAPHGWQDLIVGTWASGPDRLLAVAVLQRAGLPPLTEQHKSLVSLMLRAVAPIVDREMFASLLDGEEPKGSQGPPPEPAGLEAVDEEKLSGRQRDVLVLLLCGMSEKEVARELSVSAHTVHTHVKRLYSDFGVSSRGELLAMFVDRRVAERLSRRRKA